ncbi:CHAT domain-containing tetratricopeptide repeat protein [Hyalangium sp.]|uniref:CHAT domain-containing tetratricopeptide repeat protein n=1 Tax=Hyalangium sp. TaxID=2028555 RepID=UPI002D315F6B|nr:CHAT domain-containing tetratricopeptide repeat protein [Hyalangium sp.]HYH96814.1 CHAT domain-containing tetratricopeptide repeat protein [Hyalangium sp.]
MKEAGQYSEATPRIEHALGLWETVLAETNRKVADCLDLLGEVYLLRADYARAEPSLVRALKTREATLGENHPDVAQSLNNLARLYKAQGLYARAESLDERALQIREVALSASHPDVAQSLNNLANTYYAQGLYARAEPLYDRALKIQEATLGTNHPSVATTLNNLAFLYHTQGFYARAEPLYEQALRISEAVLGENHPEVATSLSNLAGFYYAQGHYTRAKPLYERALQIREATFGANHPDIAQSLHNLALLYKVQGFYARAEILYERALKIREIAFGTNHSSVVNSLNNLAALYHDQGFYARAEPLFERALKLQEAALGANHPSVAGVVHNLAFLYYSQGLYARAEPLFERALEIWETTLGENHPNVASSLHNLAGLYKAQGLHTRAEPLNERALKIREAALGGNHPSVANSLHTLADLYKAQGLYARAEPLYERALKIREATLSENHPDVTNSLNILALHRLAQQDLDKALPLFQRAFSSSEQHLRQEIFGFSEKRLVTVLNLLRTKEERLYALARAHSDDARVLHLALSTALLRKGRSVQEIANTSHIIYRNLDHADRENFERLRALRTQLATLSLAGPGKLSPTDYQQRLKDLADEGDRLEAALARRSEPLRRLHLSPPPAQLIPHVTAALPSDGALVEFIAYQDHSLVPDHSLPPDQRNSHLRYLALMLFADGHIRAVDLGRAEPIDLAALRLHHSLAGNAASYLPTAQALYRLAFRPLVQYLGKRHRLFLVPDGQLNLVPFAALHDGRQFLVETFDITYLTSGKDLLPRPQAPPSSRSMMVLADPDFGSSPAVPPPEPQASPALTERSASLAGFFSALRSDGPDIPWAPLPGTRQEAKVIHQLFPQAQLLLGADATKQALLKLSTPGLLHIATHGFFLEETPRLSDGRAVGYIGAVAADPVTRPADPLLRSGLVLAGAHPLAASPGSPLSEDSLVTALELAGLNLWGTQLVVLSACDTGRGDVKLGDGVYGLRRAFLVAGAETVVTSLWKVNDETTYQLMERYYRYLLAGLGRTSALREAMREMRRKQLHPHFWAAFTALGLDAPLQGMAPPPQPSK